jgi:hypothetical protein
VVWNPTRFRPLRTSGYRKPANSTVCGRSSVAGNPFQSDVSYHAVACYRELLERVAGNGFADMTADDVDTLIDNISGAFSDVSVWHPAVWPGRLIALRERLLSGYYLQFGAVGCPGCDPDARHCHLVPLIEVVNTYAPPRINDA